MKNNIELYKSVLDPKQMRLLRMGKKNITDFLSQKQIKDFKNNFYKEFLTSAQIEILSQGKANIKDFLNDEEIKELSQLGRVNLENSRICVRKVFRLSEDNAKLLNLNPYKKSEVLHQALTTFFHKVHYMHKRIGDIAISRKDSPLTGLWVEIGNNEKIKELIKQDPTLTLQLICNHALTLYFLER